MKKALALILALVLCFPLCACNEKEKQKTQKKLTTENIGSYLHIDANVIDCNISEEMKSLYGFNYKIYSGDAKIKIDVVNQSEATFSDVTIVCDVYTYVDCENLTWYGWEFDYGNSNSGKNSHSAKNSKRVTISLPNDGNWANTESLSFVEYESEKSGFLPPDGQGSGLRIR